MQLIDLERFSENYNTAIYVPEQFPGATFRLPSGVSVNAFDSGKFYCTGAKTIQLARESLEAAAQILNMFKKKT